MQGSELVVTEDEKLHGKWFIMYRKADPLNFLDRVDESEYKFVHAPTGHFYADPMIIKHGDLNYVFIETYDYKKGELAYFTIDTDLNHSEIKPIDIGINVHVSYPYVFTDKNGKFYMIPETCHLNKINLYEAVSFPDKWQFKKTLIDNIHSGDNTILFKDNKWWIFSSVHDGQTHMCIHWADDLLGDWHEHKLINRKNNPIGVNSHITRDAGNIIEIQVSENHRFFRPAQYSDDGINGEGVILYEIITLTTDNYREIPIDLKVQPLEWIRAVHTFSYNHDLLVMDARKTRSTDHKFKNIDKISIIKNMLERNIYINHEILKEAFACNTSGNGRCYYEINIDNKVYEGERNWDERWKLIKDCIPFRNMKILEIGSNMGILSTYLKTFRETSKTVCVDEPDEMLLASNKRDTIKAAKLLDKAFGIENQIDYIQIDLNKIEYEQILGEDFDFVAALSIFKWIDDKARFLDYLAKFKYVLYEGHDSDEEEIRRFIKRGFEYKILGKTQTGKSYAADDTRTLIIFTKN